MKILLIGEVPPPYGGVSVHVRRLSDFLTQCGVERRVLDIEPGALPKEGAIRVAGYFDFFRRLVSFSFRGYIPHIHTNGHNFKSWLAIGGAAWVGFFFGRRGVVTLHSGLMPDYAGRASLPVRMTIRAALRPLSKVIAVNEEIARVLLGLRIDPARLLVLPAFFPGKPSDRLPKRARLWRERFRPLVVSAVYLEKEYGCEFLIEACLRLREKYPLLGCIVMGSGSEEGTLRRRIREAGAEEWILLLGNVPHEICLAVMAKGDLFVRPALFDGDAISVREALAFGVPTVASDVGFRPEGTLRFRRGNLSDLIRQMEKGLRAERRDPPPGGGEGEENLISIRRAYEEAFR